MHAAASLLQVTSTSAATSAGAASLWVTVAEAVVAVCAVVLIGAGVTRVLRRILLRAGGSKQMAVSVTEWMGVITLLAAVGVLSTVAGLSSYLTALTISGIAGLTVSLALQATISNVISGVLLQRDGIIRLGDDIQYGGPGGVRGKIVKLSLRTTWIRSPEGVVTVIGNGNLSAGPITNHSAGARLEKRLGV
ncbi:MAG: mechanosensitive ion channel [Nitrososphaerota archaeon]|nr:mechanosensitive ion channel [Nitrososphaerota archaeon]